jgi:Haem-binding uptake, Tiki superfamily, ChaN
MRAARLVAACAPRCEHAQSPTPGARARRAGVRGRLPTGALIGTLVLVAGCAAGPWRWRSPYGLTHPLTGRIWDTRAARFLTEDALIDRLVPARFVLLGEQHDNPDHHGLQGQVIRALVGRGSSWKCST